MADAARGAAAGLGRRRGARPNLATLRSLPPLVLPSECDTLRHRLAAVARGEAFLLQGGDCAETFAALTLDNVRDKVKTLLQMAIVLTYGASVPVVKVGRIAGQYAKPRSNAVEVVPGIDGPVEIPSYRGDAVNDLERTASARRPDPQRMLRAYRAAALTLNLVRGFATGGFADLRRVHAWNADFVRHSVAGKRYEAMAGDIDRARLHAGVRRRPRPDRLNARRRTLREPRGAAARLRGAAHASRRDDGICVRPVGSSAVGGGADTATRRCTRCVCLVDRESGGGQARPDRVARRRSRWSSDSIPTAYPGGCR